MSNAEACDANADEYHVRVVRRFRIAGRLARPGDEILLSSLRMATHIVAMQNAVPCDARTARDVELALLLKALIPRCGPAGGLGRTHMEAPNGAGNT